MTWPTFQCSGTAHSSRCIRRPADSSGIAQRFLDRGAVVGLHPLEHRLLLVAVEVLDQRDGVVGLELAGDVRDLLRLHLVEQVLADIIVHFGEHVGADDPGERLDQPLALVARGELDQVGDVGRMERLRPARARSRRRRRRPRRAPCPTKSGRSRSSSSITGLARPNPSRARRRCARSRSRLAPSIGPGAALLWARPLWRNHRRAPKSPASPKLSHGV